MWSSILYTFLTFLYHSSKLISSDKPENKVKAMNAFGGDGIVQWLSN